MHQGLSIRAYARRRGVTHGAVQKALRSGRITALPDGSLDPEVVDRQWAANTDVTKPRNSVSGEPRRRRDPAGPSLPAGSAAGGGNGGTGYTQARGVRESYAAGITRLDYLERSRVLVPRGEVLRGLFTAFRTLRDRLQALPDQLDARLAASSDRAECHALLLAEVDRTLDELASAAARLEVLAAPAREPEPGAAVAS